MPDGFVYPVPVGSGGGLSDGDYGDVTVSGGGTAIDIDAGAVGNAELRDSFGLSVIGRAVNSLGSPADIISGGSDLVFRTNSAGTAIAFGTVATGGLANGAVTNAKLRDSAAMSIMGNPTIAPQAPDDIVSGAGDRVLVSNSANTAIQFSTVATAGLTNDAVTDTKLRNSGALSVIGRSANSTGDPADISVTSGDAFPLRESGGTLGFGTLATAAYANDSVTDAKLRNSAAVSVIGRSANSSGDPADIAAASDGQALVRDASALSFKTLTTTFQIHQEIYSRQSLYGSHATTPSLGALAPNSNSSPTDAENHVMGFTFPDAFITWLAWAFFVPPETAANSDVTPRLLFWLNGAPGATQVDIDIIGAVFSDNGLASGGTTFSVGTTVSLNGYASGDFVIVDLTALGISISPGQYVQGVVARDATAGNATDTLADLIRVMGIQFKGTRVAYS